MKPRERIFKALEREEPDRIPIFDWDFLRLDMRGIIKDLIGTIESPSVDPIRACGLVGLDATIVKPSISEQKIRKNVWMDEWGVKHRIITDATGQKRSFAVEPAIKTKEDMESYEMPDPCAEERMKPVREVMKIPWEKPYIFGHPQPDGPAFVLHLRGYEKGLTDPYMHPTLFKGLIHKVTEFSIEVCKMMIEEGIEVFIFGDDIAYKDGPFWSPKILREFFFPEYKRIVRELKRYGAQFVIKHTDGDISLMIDDIIDAGFDVLHPIEPPYMSLKEVKEKYGDRIAVMGNVDCAHILPFGSLLDVERDVIRCIREAAEGGGYILSSSNSIHSGVKTANFIWMVQSAKKYGKYPISGV
ncbi:MAG: Methylated-thiol--coenzyme M methyltransferase [Candidatus Bathyarchaeota archaeon BA1]|nr:MAG: Methylated-thiol--coenzyme M methyltransferase [Candidatus Bathyarchaeota archaeon BA1]